MIDPEIVTRFRNLFTGADDAYGVYIPDPDMIAKEGKKVEGMTRTVKAKVTDALYAEHLRGRDGLGIMPVMEGNVVLFAGIDIDDYGLDLVDLVKKIASVNLPLVPTRTKSGGLHLWLFMKEPTPAALVQDTLRAWSAAIGFGGVEIYPKQKKKLADGAGSWINLPWYEGDGSVRHGFDPEGQPIIDLLEWLDYAESRRQSKASLKDVKISESKLDFDDGPPCLQRLALRGFPEGTRNDGLFALAVYARKKFGDTWSDQVDVFNSNYLVPPLGSREVQTIVGSVGRREYHYPCDRAPIQPVCNRKICVRRKYGVGGGAAELDLEFGELYHVISLDRKGSATEDNDAWLLEVNDKTVRLETRDFLYYDAFRVIIMRSLEKVLPPMRPQQFQLWSAEKMKDCKQIFVPFESSAEGQLFTLLEEFCLRAFQGTTREDVLNGRVWQADDGRMYFKASSFTTFLKREQYRGYTNQELYIILRGWGIKDASLRVEDHPNPLRVWVTPSGIFDDPVEPKVRIPSEDM